MSNLTATTAHLWSRIARELVEVEQVGNTLRARGSELAVLRLIEAFRFCPDARRQYSKALDAHFFIKDMTCK